MGIIFYRLILEKFGVTAFAMEDVERYGIHEVTQRALEAINPNGDRSLHVSFDIDSLDPLEAPSTGTTGELDFLLSRALFLYSILPIFFVG
jgi:arginase